MSQGDNGWGMVSGEYASMLTMWKTLPRFIPTPIGCGPYASNADIHIFLCELVNMTEDIPEIQACTETLAELRTKGLPPIGRYGFEVRTYKGTIP